MCDVKRISLITFGCSKNLVDSEYLLKQFEGNGFQIEHENVKEGDALIINTCGFINDAKQESIETILHYAEQKKAGHIKKLIVMGCLSQRYRDELEKEIPEVDGFFGVDDFPKIIDFLHGTYQSDQQHKRFISTPGHYSYLKVAEGCNRKCAFCSIPLIRGEYKSRSFEELNQEADFLAQLGVKEVNLIAQDLTYYGYDRYKKYALPEFLEQIARKDLFSWIRMLYMYPAQFPKDVISVMKDYSSICNYLDIPFQHIDNQLLKQMRRGHTKKQSYELIEFIRRQLPDVTLRTTLMVGHPGETEKEFGELLNFVKNVQFDRLGVFTYSEEEQTYSALNYTDDIPEEVKQERADEIMKMQQSISRSKNSEKIGATCEVLIDNEDEQYYYARSRADAPEVDNEIIIQKNGPVIDVGTFQEVEIIDAYDYDLVGKIK